MTEMTKTRYRSRIAVHAALLAIILVCAMVGACGGAGKSEDGRAVERFEFKSYKDVAPLFERYNYTPETWAAGVREVPRIYLTKISPRWRDRVSSEVSILEKKRIFFRVLAPLVLRSNELILIDRERVESLAKAVAGGNKLSGEDRDWLGKIAVQYRVVGKEDGPEADAELKPVLDELLLRVDILPVSLVLAQGAEESGWGTSRFAAEGNALFGQWTWSGEGITPEGQREELGDYKIASFDSPLDGVRSYLQNLNSHPAYAELRTRRAKMRGAGELISGRELAKTLTSYSERGEEYVTTLHVIMRVNQLDPTDEAYLGDTPTIYLIPVGEGAD